MGLFARCKFVKERVTELVDEITVKLRKLTNLVTSRGIDLGASGL